MALKKMRWHKAQHRHQKRCERWLLPRHNSNGAPVHFHLLLLICILPHVRIVRAGSHFPAHVHLVRSALFDTTLYEFKPSLLQLQAFNQSYYTIEQIQTKQLLPSAPCPAFPIDERSRKAGVDTGEIHLCTRRKVGLARETPIIVVSGQTT